MAIRGRFGEASLPKERILTRRTQRARRMACSPVFSALSAFQIPVAGQGGRDGFSIRTDLNAKDAEGANHPVCWSGLVLDRLALQKISALRHPPHPWPFPFSRLRPLARARRFPLDVYMPGIYRWGA